MMYANLGRQRLKTGRLHYPHALHTKRFGVVTQGGLCIKRRL